MMQQENQINDDAQGVSFTESIMHSLMLTEYNDYQRLLFIRLFDC